MHRFDVWLRDQGDDWHDKSTKKFVNSNGNCRRNMRYTNLKIGIHVRYADDSAPRKRGNQLARVD
ncbi:hypothetical protein [Clostridium sp. CM027]|uniref:hypothetical protein n=1 Tax=Clostridium sp. CM027 TaxID=2849865 RepID=UPI00215A58AE|nr:hypothetical protein [Clostridium sp. CM027]